MYHEGAVLDALEQAPRWSVAYWADRGTDADSGTLLSLPSGSNRHLVVVDDDFVTHLGQQYPREELAALLRQVQSQADEEVLATDQVRRTRDLLLQAWSSHPGDGKAGMWSFPRGGFVRWFRDDDLHVEVSEGGTYEHPMPQDLVRILVDLGWNPPNDQFRNCWLQPGDGDQLSAATTAVLTPFAAFGCQSPPPLDPIP